MKKKRFSQILAFLIAVTCFVSGCATFEPAPFPNYGVEDYPYLTKQGDVTFAVGRFTRQEVKHYFSANLPKKNIWPVRVIITNKSERSYLVSKGMVEPRVSSSLEAARRGRRSAGHRLFWGYLLILTFFGIPIGLPLVVGGGQAMDANSLMETNFRQRELSDGKITPGETFSGILFFHRPDLPREVTLTLIDTQTDGQLDLKVDLTQESGQIEAPLATSESPKKPIDIHPSPASTSVLQ